MNIINNIHDTFGPDILKSILDYLNRNDWITISKWTSSSELTEEFITAYCYKLDWVILDASSISDSIKDVYSELIRCAFMWKDIDDYTPSHSGIKCDICIDDDKSSDWDNERNNIDKCYYNHEDGYIWCVSCWNRRESGLFKSVTQKNRYNQSRNCSFCRCVVGEGKDDQWYHHDHCDICIECYASLCNCFIYIDNTLGNYMFGGYSEGNIINSIINISPASYRHKPSKLSPSTLYGNTEWINMIPNINRTPDDFGSVRQWIIFTSDTELTYDIFSEDPIFLLVDCSAETNGRVAVGYFLYYGCFAIDIVYDTIDEYLTAYNKWKELKKIKPPEPDNDYLFGKMSSSSPEQTLNITTEFSAVVIVEIGVLDHWF